MACLFLERENLMNAYQQQYVYPENFNFSASLSGKGYFFTAHHFWKPVTMTVIAGFGEDVTFEGSDYNTNLFMVGGGSLTAILGNGINNVRAGSGDDNIVCGSGQNRIYSGAGDDVLIGGDGFNQLFAGAGNDILVGGDGYNILKGQEGDDILFFGQNDYAVGGDGADRFILNSKSNFDPAEINYIPSMTIADLSFQEGDTIDLTAFPGVIRENIYMEHQYNDDGTFNQNNDILTCYSDVGTFTVWGVGDQVVLVGGIDNAIEQGYLNVASMFGGKG